MVSAIDTTIPPFGNALTSGERANWATAKSEIEALQSGKADLNSPHFTGTPTAPTPAPGDNDTSIATTAFVQAAVVASTTGVASFNGRTGAITLTTADVTNGGGVAAASGAFTGNPTAPTQATADNSTRLATTALVTAKITAANVPAGSSTTPTMDGVAAVGASTAYARADHRHPTDTSRAPLANPMFTGDVHAGGNLYADGGAVYVSSANSYEWVIYRNASSGDHIQLHRSGWYDIWQSANGVRTWVCNGQNGMVLDGSGSLTLLGAVYAGTGFQLNQAAANGTWIADANWVYLRFSSAWGWQWSRTSGRLYYVNSGGAPLLTLSETGVGLMYPQIDATNWHALQWTGTDYNAVVNGSLLGNIVFSQYIGGAQWNVRSMGLNINGSMYAYTGGGTATWSAPFSDRRLKTNIEPTTFDALAAVNALAVYSCDLKPGPDMLTQHWDCAVIADEVAGLIPSAYLAPLDANSYASVKELPLIATLIRAVQQLTERVATLEAMVVP